MNKEVVADAEDGSGDGCFEDIVFYNPVRIDLGSLFEVKNEGGMGVGASHGLLGVHGVDEALYILEGGDMELREVRGGEHAV